MTPFKRLSQMQGHDAWLESAATRVAAGDPWATLSPEQREHLEAAALWRVQAEKLKREKGRGLTVALVFAGSAALAAVGNFAVGQWRAANAGVPIERARVQLETPGPMESPAVESVSEEAQPSVAAPTAPAAEAPRASATIVSPHAIAPAPRRVRVLPAAAAVEAPRAEASAPAPANDALDAEARLLLTALRQLRVEHDADAALKTLALHAAQFPDGTLKSEADAARTEAQAFKASRGAR